MTHESERSVSTCDHLCTGMYCPSGTPCRARSTSSSSRFMGTSASARHATAASNCTQQATILDWEEG